MGRLEGAHLGGYVVQRKSQITREEWLVTVLLVAVAFALVFVP